MQTLSMNCQNENSIIQMYERYLSAAGKEKKVLAEQIKSSGIVASLTDARKLWKRGIIWSVADDISELSNHQNSAVEEYPHSPMSVYPVAYRTGTVELSDTDTLYTMSYSVAVCNNQKDEIIIGDKAFAFCRSAPVILICSGDKGHLDTAKYLERNHGKSTVILLKEEQVRSNQFDTLLKSIDESIKPTAYFVFGNLLSEYFTGDKVTKSVAQVYSFLDKPLVTLHSKSQISYTKTTRRGTETLDRPWLVRDNLRAVDRAMSVPLSVTPDYEVVDTITVGSINFVDIETQGLDLDTNITKLQVLSDDSDTCQIIEWPSLSQIKDTLKKLDGTTIVYHNALFDAPILYRKAGVYRLSNPTTRIYDTMLISQRKGKYNANGLKYLSTFTDRRGSSVFGSFSDNAYAAEDCFATRALWGLLTENGTKFSAVDKYMSSALPTFIAQYVRGIRMDKERLQATIEDYQAQIDNIDNQLKSVANIEWNSNNQLAAWLIEQGYELPDTEKGNYKTDEATLSRLDNEQVNLVLERRGLHKTLSHFSSLFSKLDPQDGYINLLQDPHGTTSGRSTMAYIQQMSKTGPDRTMVVSDNPDGLVAAVDLSQAELRILAMVSDDNELADALISGDVHKSTAAKVFNKPLEAVTDAERRATKTVVFGTIYGASAKGLANRGMGEETELQYIQDNLKDAYPAAMSYLERVKEQAMKAGKVEDVFGKVRSLEQDIFYTNKWRAGRQAGNDVVQGPAGQLALLLHAAIQNELWKLNASSRVLFNMHDESVISVWPGEEQVVVNCVQNAFWLMSKTKLGELPLWDRLPLVGDLDFGKSWGALSKGTVNAGILKSISISTLAKEVPSYE
jgi:DNA polymerase I-like protein with 3'-5' exonuclease and polymerase domains